MVSVTKALRLGVLIALVTGLAAGPVSASEQVERPYTARDAGTFAGDPACVDFFGAGCHFDTQSTGTATHLGKTSVVSDGTIKLFFEECFLLDGVTPGLVFRSSGSFTVTAANGAQLSGTFENEGCTNPDPATEAIGTAIEGSQTITGGTGRFEDATGSTTTSGHGFGSVFDLVATGTLTY